MIPISGMFVFILPSVSLYRIFASPAVSSLTLEIVISVLPPNRSRVLGSCMCPNTQSSLVLVFPQESTDARPAVMSRPERSSGRLSRPRSPRVCLTRPGLAVGMRLAFRVPVS